MRRTVPPSAELEKRIDELLADGIAAEDPQGALSELARLGAKPVIRRAVEEEFDAFIGRARYERRPDAPHGKRNGYGLDVPARRAIQGRTMTASTRKS